MSMRDTPPFRADHVGSLLRPPRLLEARAAHADGKLDDEELRAVEDDAIREVVKLQEDVGLRTATDGEFRRSSWHMDFIYQLGGIRKVQDHLSVKFHSDEGDIEFTPVGARTWPSGSRCASRSSPTRSASWPTRPRTRRRRS